MKVNQKEARICSVVVFLFAISPSPRMYLTAVSVLYSLNTLLRTDSESTHPRLCMVVWGGMGGGWYGYGTVMSMCSLGLIWFGL